MRECRNSAVPERIYVKYRCICACLNYIFVDMLSLFVRCFVIKLVNGLRSFLRKVLGLFCFSVAPCRLASARTPQTRYHPSSLLSTHFAGVCPAFRDNYQSLTCKGGSGKVFRQMTTCVQRISPPLVFSAKIYPTFFDLYESIYSKCLCVITNN